MGQALQVMGWFANLLSREDQFASLLESAATEVSATVNALNQLLTHPSPAVSLSSFVQARANEQLIKSQIDALLCQRASSRIDPQDIVDLNLGLSRVSKSSRRFAERYMLCVARIPNNLFSEPMTMLANAASILQEMVANLRSGSVATAKRLNDQLQQIKSHSDQLLTVAMINLYHGHLPPMETIMLRDLYEMLDRIFDRSRNTGNLILQIVLKQS